MKAQWPPYGVGANWTAGFAASTAREAGVIDDEGFILGMQDQGGDADIRQHPGGAGAMVVVVGVSVASEGGGNRIVKCAHGSNRR
jgi:hypothetical protein